MPHGISSNGSSSAGKSTLTRALQRAHQNIDCITISIKWEIVSLQKQIRDLQNEVNGQ